ncbi:MAG: class I SAM-dependent DNA methyltransferase, partial [Sulfurimonas sp.]|nr:class I SAM-dependent DNA methyltransferase [Sulfurimonas sp.]
EINPDIFGSMIQTVVTPEHRGDMGMHYTSVPNIMKVMQPLFLDELYEEFEKVKTSKKKLQELINRIANLKIFDPACGSGNFLIIAYKELRRLEMKILKAIDDLSTQKSFAFSEIKLTQFYGIELDDFAHEVAILSLWLAEHQMNLEFYKAFGRITPSLPLQDGGNIVYDNATRIDWESVCPKVGGDEIYILGNPPYLGGKSQSKEQKDEMKFVFDGIKNFKELDYISCWFLLASKYIEENMKYSFVTTSSISEGAQVEQLWPLVIKNNNEIFFAYKPFNWTNNAKGRAGVTCSIIGIQKKSEESKYIYEQSLKLKVNKINGYLTQADDIYITKKNSSISNLPTMITGNSPYEGGNLMLNYDEKEALISEYPQSIDLIRKTYGSNEYIKSIDRWCLWIDNNMLDLAMSIPPIKKRIENIRELRKEGGQVARGLVNRPHQFRYRHTGKTSIIIIPIVSSSRREYIPMGILPKETIILSSAAAIYDTELYVFGILSSKIHMQWVKLTAGKLRGDIRYLSALSYNTFPFPKITDKQKEEITELILNILDEREQHSEKTLAQLYDPDKMPQGLKEAHHKLDLAIEKCYRNKPFENDEERLEYLFRLYEEMIAKEKVK